MNFSGEDLQGLSKFRSVTVQGTAAAFPCEEQARDVAAKLRPVGPDVPVIFYNNVYFVEPVCEFAAEVAKRPDLWLLDDKGQPFKPGGRYVFDSTLPRSLR